MRKNRLAQENLGMGICTSKPVTGEFLDYAVSNCESDHLCEIALLLDCCGKSESPYLRGESDLKQAVRTDAYVAPCMCGSILCTGEPFVNKVLEHLRESVSGDAYVTPDGYVRVNWFSFEQPIPYCHKILTWRTMCWHKDDVQAEYARWKILQVQTIKHRQNMRMHIAPVRTSMDLPAPI